MSAASLLSVTGPAPAPIGGVAAASASDPSDARAFDALVEDAAAEPSAIDKDPSRDGATVIAAPGPPPTGPLVLPGVEDTATAKGSPEDPTLPQVQPGAPGKEDGSAPQVQPGLRGQGGKEDVTAPQVQPGVTNGVGKEDVTGPQVQPGVRGKGDERGPLVLPADVGPAPAGSAPPTAVPTPAQTPAQTPAGAGQGVAPRPVADRTSPTPDAGTGKRNASAVKEGQGPQILPRDVGPDGPGVEPVAGDPGAGSNQFDLASGSGSPAPAPPAATAQAAPRPVAEAAPAQPAASGETPATQGADAPPAARDVLHFGQSRVAIEATAQIAAQIVKRLEGRSTRFQMALTPDDLGRVDVTLDIDADGALAARLAFDNPAAAAELRGRVEDLRRQLEDAGFRLAEDALQFAERDPSSGRRDFDRGRESAFARAGRLNAQADDALAPAQSGRWINLSLTPDRVDLKV